TGSFTASDKVYVATTVAQIGASGHALSARGWCSGVFVDIVDTGATGSFGDKNVGDGKAVTLNADGSGLLDGGDAGNYVISTAGEIGRAARRDSAPAAVAAAGGVKAAGKVVDGATDDRNEHSR